jgi:uncharacterized protein YndB with AHSA1/START domain
LRRIFDPEFILHDLRPSGANEITTRWTMRMTLTLARPLRRWWAPQLVFTGESVMSLNPETGEIADNGKHMFAVTAGPWKVVVHQRIAFMTGMHSDGHVDKCPTPTKNIAMELMHSDGWMDGSSMPTETLLGESCIRTDI